MSYIRTYSELMSLSTFIERYNYLKLEGIVGEISFGHDRYLNQRFYSKDPEWLSIRNKIIIRDDGCDLGIKDREITKMILIHHINPITKEDILFRTKKLFDPENLICTSKNTHDAIHYGDENILLKDYIPRTKNDTCPWRT